MHFSRFLSVLSLFAVLVAFGNAAPEARLISGQKVDSLRQFPFFVYITSVVPYGFKCSGSILNAQWILTSAGCIKHFTRFELNFAKENEHDIYAGYFSISVNSDQVYVYPTEHDDLALIKIPTRLVFSDTISPVYISNSSIDSLRNKFAVLPGFDSNYEPPVTPPPYVIAGDLVYGMFNILDQSVCRQEFAAKNFNEYNQLCADGWGSNPNAPCDKEFGSPLVVGWPARSEIVGIFSALSPSCVNNTPFVYTFVPKYLTWIETMIQG